MDSLKLIIIAILLTFSSLCSASPFYGSTVSYVVLAKEPPTMHGFQLMLDYDPDRFKWRQFNVFFDGGYSRFWVTNNTPNKFLNIISAAPVIRYTFKQRGYVKPYLDISIGIAYLDHTYLDNRNLGMHFSFQDRMGIGVLFGKCDQYELGLHAVHYSNAKLSPRNSGISASIALDFGYSFR